MSFFTLRHVREYHHGMVEGMTREVGLDASVCRDGLLCQLYRVNKFGFIDEEP